MGEKWIQRYKSKEYLDAFDASTLKSNGKYRFFPLGVGRTKLQLIPLSAADDCAGSINNDGLEIGPPLINVIKEILSSICEYDACVQRYVHLENSFNFSLNVIYFCLEEVQLRYWGDLYNTGWSAFLSKSKKNQWFISDWG